MSKTIFFDIGNVLIRFSLDKMCQNLAFHCGVSPSEIKKAIFETDKELDQNISKNPFDQGAFINYELGLISTEEIYQKLERFARKPLDFTEIAHAFVNIFDPIVEMIPLVESLKEKGHRLILLSNNTEVHFNYVYSHYPVLQLFDDKILSFEVGLRKPDPLIFKKALSLCTSSRENCFYTDDVPSFVQAAKSVGLDAETFTTPDLLKTHLETRGFL